MNKVQRSRGFVASWALFISLCQRSSKNLKMRTKSEVHFFMSSNDNKDNK